jgi:vitamin K-dependent gamma-carboxylase
MRVPQLDTKRGHNPICCWRRLNILLFRRTGVAWIVCLRFALGILLFFHVWGYIRDGLIEPYFVIPQFHAKYPFCDWIGAPAGLACYVLFYFLCVCAICISLGLYYRFSSLAYCIGYTYIFLADRAYYQNHDYLVCLLSLLLVVFPANSAIALDSFLGVTRSRATIPRWPLLLFRLQIAVVYLYAGVAKLDRDWLAGYTAEALLSARKGLPGIGPFIDSRLAVGICTYGGLLLDLLVVPLLIWKRTRLVAFMAAAGFHVLNSRLFNIGVFPWLAIASTACFFPASWFDSVFRFLHVSLEGDPNRNIGSVASTVVKHRRRAWVIVYVAIYSAIQIIVPLRHFMLDGNPNWTHRGQTFSWRMMLASRKIDCRFYATNGVGAPTPINCLEYLSLPQINRVAMVPDCAAQFARYLKEHVAFHEQQDIKITASIWVSLNGRAPQLLVDPIIDLANPELATSDRWIMPLDDSR